MHILIIPSAYPTKDAPLRSTFFKEQALALKKAGNTVGVIYNETRRITGINLNALKNNHFQIREYCEDGLNTLRLHGWNIFMMRNKIGIDFWIKNSLKLYDIYCEKYGNPDIIHVHCGLYGGVLASIIKEKYNIKYVITEHASIVMNNLLDDYHKKLLSKAYNNADKLIAVGEKLKKSMMNYTTNDIVVVPNIVDTSIFNYGNNKKSDKFIFASVCLLTKNKNVDKTIKAFAKNFKGKSNIELMIIGSGPEKTFLEGLVKELGVEKQINFVGAVNRENLKGYLEKATAFVLPSSFETFGIAYIEALACGLPIIATKCGGPEDFYKDYLGYMIPKDDDIALDTAMNDMVENIDNFDRDKIAKYVIDTFSSEVISEKLNKIFFEVINNRQDGK